MKKAAIFLILLSALLTRQHILAQSLQNTPPGTFAFSVYIRGTAAQPPTVTTNANGTKHVVFPSLPSLTNILSQYTIGKFELLLPAARRPYLHNYWVIEAVDGQDLMNTLITYSNTMFREAHAITPPTFTFTPNDMPGQAYGGNQNDLKAIKAEDAWGITQGDPAVVVGVVDVHFQLDHPDLIGKIVNVRSNPPGSDHGTTVAGSIACGTNNNTGQAAIGFNSTLDVTSESSDNGMLDMSEQRKIINASWFQNCTPYWYTPADSIVRVQAYDNVYENGAIAIWGAGNGPAHCNYLQTYPSAFQHNFAVSSVGYDKNPVATENLFDVHEKIPGGDQALTHNHNWSIDLVAPGYNRHVLFGNSNNPAIPLYSTIDGTSHAAPLVSGTAALMEAASNKCLSPYQMEYLLKLSADASLYNNPLNATYIDKLGAGRLDAFAAVQQAEFISGSTDPCNDPTTQTMMIKGIELNTICAPGHSSNNALPQFTPIITEGTYPLSYRWVPLNDNTTTLDAYNIANPTVISATGTSPVAHYYLVVKDASETAQKVASKEIKVPLKTSGFDLAMRDGYMDMLNEPNTMRAIDERDAIWWDGHDIWNRRVDDGLTEHQDPEYFVNNFNYLYTKVRNVGCAASPASGMKLRLYWTLQSTGEIWTSSWTTANFVTQGQTVLPAGRELTVSPYAPIDIPILQPGESSVLKQEWRPGRPADYDQSLTALNACVLARIEQTPQAPYGMTFSEQIGPVGPNVTNNNNIITRNMNFVDLAPGDIVPMHLAIIENPLQVQSAFTLQFLNDRSIHRELSGNFSAVALVRVHLDRTLYALWVKGGQLGNFAAYDDQNYTVDFDGSTTMELSNLVLEPGERIPYRIEFILRDGALLSDMNYLLHVRQIFEKNTEGESITLEDNIVGGISFQVHTRPRIRPASKTAVLHSGNNLIHVYPNPASDAIYISYTGKNQDAVIKLFDVTGRQVLSTRAVIGINPYSLNLNSLRPGIYIVATTDAQGKTERIKIVKR